MNALVNSVPELSEEAQAVWEQELRETFEVYAKWYGWNVVGQSKHG